MDISKIDSTLFSLGEVFSRNGFQSFLVGGAVRDILMGRKVHDFDIATDALPKDVIRIFKRVIPTGIEHGTVTIKYRHNDFETTTFRTEHGYTDARHPDKVELGGTIATDLARRDFTMNAVAICIKTGEVVDLYGGQGDIAKKIIRCVGEPLARFMEDGLRPIRAIRFMAQLGFTIEEATLAGLSDAAVHKRMEQVSIERFRDEFTKTLLSPSPKDALMLAMGCGLLAVFTKDTINDEAVASACRVVQKKLEVVLAALFFRLGKDGAKKEITHLKYTNNTINAATHLVDSVAWGRAFLDGDIAGKTDTDARKFVCKAGKTCVADAFSLWEAVDAERVQEIKKFRALCEEAVARGDCTAIQELAVNGDDLLAAGVKRGKVVGMTLQKLLDSVIDEPALNKKDVLLRSALDFQDEAAAEL